MGKNCGSGCVETACFDADGKKQMIAKMGNIKYPQGLTHGQCRECLSEIIEHGELMILFNNDEKLVERYKRMMGEHKKP